MRGGEEHVRGAALAREDRASDLLLFGRARRGGICTASTAFLRIAAATIQDPTYRTIEKHQICILDRHYAGTA